MRNLPQRRNWRVAKGPKQAHDPTANPYDCEATYRIMLAICREFGHRYSWRSAGLRHVQGIADSMEMNK